MVSGRKPVESHPHPFALREIAVMAARSRFEMELAACERPRSSAELRASGISRAMTGGTAWRRTSRGFYVSARDENPTLTPTQRILDAAPLVGANGAIGGWAAAYAAGIDALDGFDPYTMRELPVLIYQGDDVGCRARSGIVRSRERLLPGDVVERRGIRITTLNKTCFDGARLAPRLEEAVAFVDAMAHAGSVRLPAVEALVAARPGWKGIAQARVAVSLADPATRSTWETRLRICYVVEARLPRPQVNLPVFDREGRLLGIPDLLDEEAGFVVEFDGQHHRLRRQHRDDNVREELFESAGLTVARADSIDLGHYRTDLVRRLVDGHSRGLRRDRRHDRWTTVPPSWWFRSNDSAERRPIFGRYDT